MRLKTIACKVTVGRDELNVVCLLLATCVRYVACGFSSFFLCIHVSTSVQTIIAEKLIGFQLTKKFVHCVEP